MNLDAPSDDSVTRADLGVAEFRELRATIRERGTARAFVSAITFVSWGALVLVAAQGGHPVVGALVPLVVLAAGFETTFALHVGTERIGRYLFARYEASGSQPKWETAVARFGRTSAAARLRVQPLLHVTFTSAVLVNLAIAVAAPWSLGFPALLSTTVAITASAHLLFLIRLWQAVSQSAGQRDRDAAAFADIERSRGQLETKSN